jgi:predicted flavoprotein YhiN
LHETLRSAGARPGGASLSRTLPLELPRRLIAALAHQAGCNDADPRLQHLEKRVRHALVEAVKGLRVAIDGTRGYDYAEVTAGGLSLTAVDAGTMRVKGQSGLYACGEVLDLQGPIGGLNFQAAFATAELAARDAARM